MAPPSALIIATNSVQRLLKEEATYHKELKSQEARLQKLLADEVPDDNRDFIIKQERTAIEETRAVFSPLKQRVVDAMQKLEDLLDAKSGQEIDEDSVKKAKDVLESAKKLIEA
ncbi:hypothetical protein K3495_g7397 [Podosphaera aphanis]|nr:hypothetical protein K3495_g7397 [Podosphaera aphanis]